MCPYFYLFSQKSLEVAGFGGEKWVLDAVFGVGFEAEIELVLGDLCCPDAIRLMVLGWSGSDLAAKTYLEIDLFLGFFVGFLPDLWGFWEDFVSQVGILAESEIWCRAGSVPKCEFSRSF
jgi:hypothetical protein